jgi:prepilin-type N-terminal cleavage/methylation domain-containing protein
VVELPVVSRRERAAFTLIELLVVMAIMAIIVALVVAVGKYVREESAEQETKSTQSVVDGALHAYYDIERRFPEPAGHGSEQGNTKELLDCLMGNPKSREMLNQLSRDAWALDEETSDHVLRDGWGREMRYELKLRRPHTDDVGVPVLISAGPDGKFGDTDADRERQKDNIRSDGR